MTDFVYDPNHSRVRKARYRAVLQKKTSKFALIATGAVSTGVGVTMLTQNLPVGWLLLLPGAGAAMDYLWYKGELEDLPPAKGEGQLHLMLEASLLAKLPDRSDLSAYDVWKGLENGQEHIFLHNRYGVDASFFETFIDKNPGSAQQVWQAASALAKQRPGSGLSNMVVLIGLVHSVAGVEQIMRNAALELKDVDTAIDWWHDTQAKRALARSKRHTGGIGRDWAYGYTPILRRMGHNISEGIERHGFFSDTSMHHRIVQQMVQIMDSSTGTVTLVGEEGVGKTTCVYSFAEVLLTGQQIPKKIRYNQVVQLDASTLLANTKRPGELEDLMIHILNEAHRAKNIILFFDEAQVFFGIGSGVDISHVLQPALESNSIRLVLAMAPQAWQRLSANGLAARLSPVNVPAADEANTIAVLRDQVGLFEYRHNVVYTYEALQEAFKLGSRYVTTQAMPGAALQVLQQTAATAQQKLITRAEVQHTVEQTYGIKLQAASAQDTDKLLHLEEDLRKQVISQDRAISVIANALRRSRSGVGNPNRPIGTFLFLGPTGVGKTELSKALARSYFGSENAIIRVDMNQFVNSGDVQRLIAPMQGSELGFLGEVRKKPFSVILLDEIEKAHSSVVNALLQMLDEGMMRDSDNKTVSFRDAIIIATSNAGADEIRKLIEEGKDITELESTFADTLIKRGDFAPEFINRFDEVVLFKPLAQEELVQVIDLIVADVNKTLDNQKVNVVLTDAAKRWLVTKGYDSRLGARPIRRMVQRYVENIVAKRLLEHSVQPGGSVQLDVADLESVD